MEESGGNFPRGFALRGEISEFAVWRTSVMNAVIAAEASDLASEESVRVLLCRASSHSAGGCGVHGEVVRASVGTVAAEMLDKHPAASPLDAELGAASADDLLRAAAAGTAEGLGFAQRI